jgi:hypothetical protein
MKSTVNVSEQEFKHVKAFVSGLIRDKSKIKFKKNIKKMNSYKLNTLLLE